MRGTVFRSIIGIQRQDRDLETYRDSDPGNTIRRQVGDLEVGNGIGKQDMDSDAG